MFLVAHSYQCFLGNCKRRLLLLGVRAMTTSSLPANLLLAEEIPKNYPSSVNFEDWICGSLKFSSQDSTTCRLFPRILTSGDIILLLRTERGNRRMLGSLKPKYGTSQAFLLVRYAAPDQMPTIYSMQEVVSLPILSVYRFLLAKNTSFKSGDFQTLLCLLISFFLTKDLTCSLLGRSCTLTVTVEKISQSA
ncbi:hypothetical protein NC652_020482 [Populus alba x Populus x berolinensis]|nr:hypothetical protein NC652_020482 [Populus alba x Populus x berolinensis]